MQAFMDKDFLLSTETARKLFHEYAADCPIIDYHCHLNPREIWEDVKYENITQVWLGGDHYKWRLMRCAGVPEKYITGTETTDYEKFCKWAEVVGKAIGLKLKGIDGGPHKQWIMWFNSTQREEPYQDLTSN